MRQIILDTETTGLDPSQGHRIIEIAAIEMANRRLTGNFFHRYLNPEREIDPGAIQVHGITPEFLQDKPRFCDIADEFAEFIRGAQLIIHNAAFDVSFINAELGLLKMNPLTHWCTEVICTLQMAKTLHPGQRNNLDALCKRYGVDNASRTFHGALLDCELLAAVYLSLTRGQESLSIGFETRRQQPGTNRPQRPQPIVLQATAEELSMHELCLQSVQHESKGRCMWLGG